jgi:low affinity Fe/Cu permease
MRSYGAWATSLARAASTPWAPLLAVALIAAWVAYGLANGFTTQWQVALNTAGILVTLLMVFLLQHAERRDMRAVQLKLDELVDAVEGADEGLIGSERLSQEELERLRRARRGRPPAR